MAQTIKLKRSATTGNVPTTSQLALGELGINTTDGKLFLKKSVSGTESIVEVGGLPLSGGTLTGSLTAPSLTVGNITSTGNLTLSDVGVAYFGTGYDLRIYHDGSNSYIKDNGTGNLNIQTNGVGVVISDTSASDLAVFNAGNGVVTLYKSGAPKLATTSTGIDVTGSVVADGFQTDTSNTNFNLLARNSSNTAVYIQNGGSGNILDVQSGSMSAGQGTSHFRVANNGAATFSNSVTSTGLEINGTRHFDNDYNVTYYRKANHTTLGYQLFRDNGKSFYEWNSGGTHSHDFEFVSNNSSVLNLSTNGNVNIPNGSLMVGATTAPNADLHLGAASPHIDIGPSTGNRGKVGFDSNNVYIGCSSNTGEIHFKNNISSTDAPQTSGDTLLTLADGGNASFSGAVTSTGLTAKVAQTANTVMEVAKITTSGSYSSSGSSGAGGALTFGQYDDTYPAWKLSQIASVRNGSGWNGDLVFYINNGTSQTSIYERMRLSSAGNLNLTNGSLMVGSTTAPTHKLEVVGNAMLSTSDGFMYLSNVGVGNAGIYVRGIGQNGTLRSHTTTDFRWEVTGGEKMLLNSSGLDVSGSVTAGGHIITNTSSRIENQRISMEADGTLDWGSSKQYGTLTWDTNKAIIVGQQSSSLEFRTNLSGVAMTMDTSQNVNIPNGSLMVGATTAPSAKLQAQVNNTATPAQIATDSNAVLLLENTNASGSAGIRLRGGNGAGVLMYGENNSTDKFYLTPRNDTGKSFTLDHVGNGIFQGSVTATVASPNPKLKAAYNSSNYIGISHEKINVQGGGVGLIIQGNGVDRATFASGGGLTLANGDLTLTSGSVTTNKLTLTKAPVGTYTIEVDGTNTGQPNLIVKQSTSERFRCDNNGNLLVGKTALDFGAVGAEILPTGVIRSAVGGGHCLMVNRKDSDGEIINFRKDSATVGSIGTPYAGELYIEGSGANSSGLLFTSGNTIQPRKNGAADNGNIDLGTSGNRFKDLYLSGTAFSGGAFSAGTTGNSVFFAEGSAHIFRRGSAGSYAEFGRFDTVGNLLVGTTNVAAGVDNTSTGHSIASQGYATHSRSSGIPLFLNRNSNDGTILDLRKNGASVGSIGTSGGDIYIDSVSGGVGLLANAGTGNYGWTSSFIYPTTNNARDLGTSNFRFKDLYLSGGINVGDAKTVGHGAISLKYDLVYMTAGVISPADDDGTDNDNSVDLGKSAARFNDIFATNGTIQTSDRNEKQDIEELSDAEQRVAVAAKGLLKKFRWKDAVEDKGDDARIHFGIIAQDLQAAFEAEGLDAGRYGMFTSNTWTNEDGEEQTRMGVRYSELLAFIISAI